MYRFSDGAVYEGEYKGGAMAGFGTYQYVDGRAEVGRYADNVDTGEGVRWSADRATAWRLCDGKVIEEVSLDTADRIARKLGKTRLSDSMPSGSGHERPSVGGGSGRRPTSGGSSKGGVAVDRGSFLQASAFAAPHAGAGGVAAAPTRSSRKSSSGRSRCGAEWGLDPSERAPSL